MMRGTILMGHMGPEIIVFRLLGFVGIALLVIAVILLVKYRKKTTKAVVNEAGAISAIETVKMLYAQGTIDEAEYSKRLAVLNGNVYIDTNKEEATAHAK
ncbi:MAG: SHOCT domain-containing protein [Peptostreptococcaceae bacterium]|nr:SHOCT domain-containing protein [Peptostreptococcaceae bacterium]